ncbi:hypothetical protein LCGC14_1356130 [marine sediment metagenome]|uniref:Uncharacterized protein n=1 Tax=marine sediment metagenome TaxID=412755 RepID=A0A0F9KA60_9ZZZZ
MSRPRLVEEDLQRAREVVRRELLYQLATKGDHAFVSSHEVLGVVTEEYAEIEGAVQSNDLIPIMLELRHMAVACLLGLASIRAKALNWPHAPDNIDDAFPAPGKDQALVPAG